MSDSSELLVSTAGVGSEADLRHARPSSGGEILLRVKSPGTFTVEVGGEAILTITRDAASTRIDLGPGGGERLVLGDRFRAFLNDFIAAKFDAHVHGIAQGVTTPPQPAFVGTVMPEELLSGVSRTR